MVGAGLDRATGQEVRAVFACEQNDTAQIRTVAATAGSRGDVNVLACLLRRASRNEWLWSGAFEGVDVVGPGGAR